MRIGRKLQLYAYRNMAYRNMAHMYMRIKTWQVTVICVSKHCLKEVAVRCVSKHGTHVYAYRNMAHMKLQLGAYGKMAEMADDRQMAQMLKTGVSSDA